MLKKEWNLAVKKDIKEAAKKAAKKAAIETEEKTRIETARKMLKDNLDIDSISKYTGLSKEEIKKL